MQAKNTVRRAAKAGSWYEADGTKLNQELTAYMDAAEKTLPQRHHASLKAIIGPHAGFTYSGPNAAWAYKNIDPNAYDRVLLLGPSH
jgi:MEMO1 family protein